MITVIALIAFLLPAPSQECYYTFLNAEVVTASEVRVQSELTNYCEPSTFIFEYQFFGPCEVDPRRVTLEIDEFEREWDIFRRDARCVGKYRVRLAVEQVGFGPLVRREAFFEVIPYAQAS